MEKIEKYGVFEWKAESVRESLLSPGNAVFEKDGRRVEVSAFSNGEDEYRVRFMPDEEGIWRFHVTLAGQEVRGEFECVPNFGKNHGRVVVDGYHFKYEDGERYIPFGTTCYAWIHQTEELRRQTLKTLARSPFNKIRMCVFPKSMPYNTNDPERYPFLKGEDGAWDVSRPDPAFWEMLDESIKTLMEMGVEVDLILFHPYDRWGFSELSQKESLVYLEYCVHRLSAYRNV